jgi:hypothetical protein
MTTERSGPLQPWWTRPSAWIAVTLLVASLAMIAFALASLVLPGNSALPNRPDIVAFLAVASAFVAMPTIGTILAILRPSNPIGWMFLVSGTGIIVGIFSSEYVGRAVYLGTSLPGVAFVDWLNSWAWVLALCLMVIWIPLLFPDGHLPGPRWRPVAWAAAATMVAAIISSSVATGHAYSGVLPNPIGIAGPIGDAASLFSSILVLPLIAVLGILALASLVVRFRRSRNVERQQLKWFLLAVGFLVAAVIVAFGTQIEAGWYAMLFGLALLPVSAGVAVLRYRLYDIDRVISRTVAYATVTAILATVFVGGILLFQAVLSSLIRGNSVAVAGSTLVVAALFQPLRRRIQSRVDRRFNRARYDAERTVAAFSERLRNDVDLESLGADVQGVVAQTVAPVSMALWMRRGDPET